MSRLISRDPFARTELHRETIDAVGLTSTCSWCGNCRKGNKLFVYFTESDSGKRHNHNGQFCSKGCHDDYHS